MRNFLGGLQRGDDADGEDREDDGDIQQFANVNPMARSHLQSDEDENDGERLIQILDSIHAVF